MKEIVVIVDPVSSGKNLSIAAFQLGYEVIALFTLEEQLLLENNKSINTDEFKPYGYRYYFTRSTLEAEEAIAPDIENIVAVISGSEPGVALADYLADKLGLPGNDILLTKARRDKGIMRQKVKEAGLANPDFRRCYTESDVKEFCSTHTFPLVIKTNQGAGSNHVYICHTKEDAVEKFHIIKESKNLFGNCANYAVLEEYIEGTEYIIDVFMNDGICHIMDVWYYKKIDLPWRANIYYETICLESPYTGYENLIEYAKKIPGIIGIKLGPAHLEVKLHPQKGPMLIEVGARLAGINLPLLWRQFSNFDPFQTTIKTFVNGRAEIPTEFKCSKKLAVIMNLIEQDGIVESIKGIERIMSLPSYFAHMLHCKSGDRVSKTCDLSTVPIIIFLANEKQEMLAHDIKLAHDIFKIEINPIPAL